jgi:hypothetical protein
LSGDNWSEVTVSVWPSNVYVVACFRKSHTLMSLSMPPVNSSLPASARHIAVMGKSVGMKVTASFVRVSHICNHVRHIQQRLDQHTHSNVTVV